MRTTRTRLLDAERGASAVEYALMVALIAAVVFAVIGVLGTSVIPLYDVKF